MTIRISDIGRRLKEENERTDAERDRLQALIRRHTKKSDSLTRHGTTDLLERIGDAMRMLRPSWTTRVSGPYGLMSECYLTVSDAARRRDAILLIRKDHDMTVLIGGREERGRPTFDRAPDDIEAFAALYDAMLDDPERSSPTKAET